MGAKSKKKAKTRLDAYYRLAKEQGYRARSAFKLIQLNRKYDFLSKSRVVVDLCAAPGGWCQVCAKYMPIGSKVVGVDLVPIQPIRGVKTFVGDITDDRTRKMIVTWLKKEPVDAVIHDGAPNVGGVWAKDLFAQNSLVLCALKMACSMLKPQGWFISKVFRSQDFQKIIWLLKQFFDKVEATKPLASRMESAEIFVVCAGYKAPKHIDPKMFNAQAVFADVGEEKVMTASGALVAPKSNVPMGYEEFATVVHRTATFSEFLAAADPKEFLKTHHEIRFPEEDRVFLQSRWSKKELQYLCQDLQQVGPADQRRLLKWREQLLREQQAALQEEEGGKEAEVAPGEEGEDAQKEQGEDGEEGSPDDTEAMAKELLRLRKQTAKEIKKKEKRVVDRKLKQIRGLINYDPHDAAQHPTDPEGHGAEERQEEELEERTEQTDEADFDNWNFSKLATVEEADVSAMMDKHWEEPDANEPNAPLVPVMDADLKEVKELDMGEEGEDAERLQLEEGNELAFDVDAYGNYIEASDKNRTSVYADPNAHHVDEEGGEDKREKKQPKSSAKPTDDNENLPRWRKHQKAIEGILNSTFPKPRDGKRKRQLEEDVVEMGGEAASPAKSSSEGSDSSFSSDDDVEDEPTPAGRVDSRRKKEIVPESAKLLTAEMTKQHKKDLKQDTKRRRKEKDSGFEEIPAAMADPDVRARTLAIATKMLDKKARHEMLDNSINRYTFNDDDELPDWFVKDEQRNCKVILPVTAADVEAQRQRFLELNSRPGKKVMEAMGRKRRRAQRMLHGMLEKGANDPRAREKLAGMSVRKILRSKKFRQPGDGHGEKKQGPLDRKLRGQQRRERDRVKKLVKGRKGRR